MDIVPVDLLDGFNGYEPQTIACQYVSQKKERIGKITDLKYKRD